jgi:hypothetical protein
VKAGNKHNKHKRKRTTGGTAFPRQFFFSGKRAGDWIAEGAKVNLQAHFRVRQDEATQLVV